jgi:hypothetical protein
MALTHFEDLEDMLDSLPIDHIGILSLINPRRIDNPIKSARIEEIFNIGGPAVRKVIRYYRLTGIPIGSSSKGYYIATSKEEYALTLAHLKERAMKELQLVSAGEKINWNQPIGEQLPLGL